MTKKRGWCLFIIVALVCLALGEAEANLASPKND